MTFNKFKFVHHDHIISVDTTGAVRLLKNNATEDTVAFYDVVQDYEELLEPHVRVEREEADDWIYIGFWDTVYDRSLGSVYLYKDE